MINSDSPPSDALVPLSVVERTLYERIVPEEHFLRRLLAAIDFESFRPLLLSSYSPDMGRRPLDPVVLLKLETLARQYNLSDREVIAGARYNIAHRLFLDLSLESPLPHHTLLTYFRLLIGLPQGGVQPMIIVRIELGNQRLDVPIPVLEPIGAGLRFFDVQFATIIPSGWWRVESLQNTILESRPNHDHSSQPILSVASVLQ